MKLSDFHQLKIGDLVYYYNDIKVDQNITPLQVRMLSKTCQEISVQTGIYKSYKDFGLTALEAAQIKINILKKQQKELEYSIESITNRIALKKQKRRLYSLQIAEIKKLIKDL